MSILILTTTSAEGTAVFEIAKTVRDKLSGGGEEVKLFDMNGNFDELKEVLIESNKLVLVVPVYYFSVPLQFRNIINRFGSMAKELRAGRKKAALIAAVSGDDERAANELISHYKMILRFMDWEDIGVTVLTQMVSSADVKQVDFALSF